MNRKIFTAGVAIIAAAGLLAAFLSYHVWLNIHTSIITPEGHIILQLVRHGDADSVKVDLSASDGTYSDKELMKAVGVIRRDFFWYLDCQLVELKLCEVTEEGVCFVGTFRTGPLSGEEAMEPNALYEGWHWDLQYRHGMWEISGCGYG